jgi:exonuclease VII small subunit
MVHREGDRKMETRKKTLFVMAALFAATMILTSGCSEPEREEIKAERDEAFAERQWEDGVREVNKGLEQLDAFDQKLAEAEPESAKRHLKKTAEHFNKALTHFEKAEVGRERQGAIDDLNAGSDALDKAYKDFEEGEVESAQSHLDRANELFAKAAETLRG